LIQATSQAIAQLRRKAVNPKVFHQEIQKMYSWYDIAGRTEKVYNEIMQRNSFPLIDRLKRFYGCGAWAGKLFCLLIALDFLLLCLLEFCFPKDRIDIARDWPRKPVQVGTVKRDSVVKGKERGRGVGFQESGNRPVMVNGIIG
jgi:phosphatidylinositol N-acetylglucosaminyltransferase subunit A